MLTNVEQLVLESFLKHKDKILQPKEQNVSIGISRNQKKKCTEKTIEPKMQRAFEMNHSNIAMDFTLTLPSLTRKPIRLLTL